MILHFFVLLRRIHQTLIAEIGLRQVVLRIPPLGRIQELVAFYGHFVVVFDGVTTITGDNLEDGVAVELHVISKDHHTLSEFFRLRGVVKLGEATQTEENALVFTKEALKVQFSQVAENVPLFGEFINRRVMILLLDRLDQLFSEVFVPLMHQHAYLASSLLIFRSHFRQRNCSDNLRHIFRKVELTEVGKEGLVVLL